MGRKAYRVSQRQPGRRNANTGITAPAFFMGDHGGKTMRTITGNESRKGLFKMPKFFLAMMFAWIYFLAVCQSPCFAATVALSWDPNTEPDLAGYKVYYKADSSSLPFDGTGAAEGASPLDSSSQASATISGLDPNKAHFFAVTAYNTSGVESSFSNIVSIPELAPPATSLNYPLNNATVSGTVSVTASASDNVGVTKVEYYVNGILQASDTSSPYVYSWNTTSVASGTYTLMTKAYDAAGNVGQSSVVTVTVINDATAPTVSLIAPGNGSTLSGTVTITASASDNVGVNNVELYENGVLLFASNVAPYSYNWNTTTVANGSYTLTAKAYDNAGNMGQSSNTSVTVNNVVPDTVAPTVSAFTPAGHGNFIDRSYLQPDRQ